MRFGIVLSYSQPLCDGLLFDSDGHYWLFDDNLARHLVRSGNEIVWGPKVRRLLHFPLYGEELVFDGEAGVIVSWAFARQYLAFSRSIQSRNATTYFLYRVDVVKSQNEPVLVWTGVDLRDPDLDDVLHPLKNSYGESNKIPYYYWWEMQNEWGAKLACEDPRVRVTTGWKARLRTSVIPDYSTAE